MTLVAITYLEGTCTEEIIVNEAEVNPIDFIDCSTISYEKINIAI